MLSRLAYRARQFWNALLSPRRRVETRAIFPPLTSAQLILFRRMQPSEQVHAYQVFQHLKASGHSDSDLLVAALLHDVGKVLYPLSIFGRVVIALGKHLFPRSALRWGGGRPRGLRRPFVVAVNHAAWGADLAAQVGASSKTVELIRCHQDLPVPETGLRTGRLLAALQAADDES